MDNPVTSAEWTIPPQLKVHDIWAIWTPEFGKQIMAPWQTGHCYPAAWGDQEHDRPETDFETAKMVADLPPSTVHESYPFPADDGEPTIPDRLLPTIMLPHEPPTPPIMLVDFDDVRDPETGHVPPAVRDIVEDLDAYTEISQSGEGLHVFVRAALPGALGKFIGEIPHRESIGEYSELSISPDGEVLDVRGATPESAPNAFEDYPLGHALAGAIELYDHGRVVGATWDHVDGTPLQVPERQSLVDDLVERFESSEQRERRKGSDPERPSTERPTDIAADIRDGSGGQRSVSPYYRLSIRSIADVSTYRQYRKETPGDQWQGPHPRHGPLHSDAAECTNFGIDTSADSWYCFAHESGGAPLHLAAVLAPTTNVNCADVPKKGGASNWLQNKPVELLRTCLWVRDNGGVPADAKPPYAALLGVARIVGIQTQSPDTLGKTAYSVARSVYDELQSGEVSEIKTAGVAAGAD